MHDDAETFDASTTPTAATVATRALDLQLDAVGITRAEAYDDTEQYIVERREAGLFADLKFTMAQPDVSCHPESLVDGARSVISAALSYWHPDGDVPEAAHGTGTIARFARADPYVTLRDRLEQIADWLRTHGHECRVLVDSNDHVDRAAAIRSGVGFSGKNTMLITPRHGSWVVLGTIVTTAELEPTEPMRPGCGSCTACIDACPTDAINADGGVLDTGACIGYWTQSHHQVPDEIAQHMDDMVYGCDICQDVCPWNRGTEKRRAAEEPWQGQVDLVAWLEADRDELNEAYDRFFVPRRNVSFLRRNALIAMGNRRNERDVPIIAAQLEHSDRIVRRAARQALRLNGTTAAINVLESNS
uniref:Iron-sulfur cluster binding protein n=1 Tax=uncultured bacterium W5-102b TaxID=1130996 RepID=H9BWK0_9BACT|nr:iron-sulfur cluster binding protein [uncultured bacterium W5-102b]